MSRIGAQGIHILTWDDEIYPRRLKEIDQPPPVLYMRGELKAEDFWSVAVVGTRRVSAYGRQVADELAMFLANNGVTVISGLHAGWMRLPTRPHSKPEGEHCSAWLRRGPIYPPENTNWPRK